MRISANPNLDWLSNNVSVLAQLHVLWGNDIFRSFSGLICFRSEGGDYIGLPYTNWTEFINIVKIFSYLK